MDIFSQIILAFCAIYVFLYISRPRTKEEWEKLEDVKKYPKEHPEASKGQPLGLKGTIIFWICFVLISIIICLLLVRF